MTDGSDDGNGAGLPRRPIFWFIWPTRPAPPLDEASVQVSWLRVSPRGPWRLIALIAATVIAVSALLPTLAALVIAPSPLAAIGWVLIGAPVIACLSRAWVCGTFVADRGLKISRMLTTRYLPWNDVMTINVRRGRTPWLGTPLRMSGARCLASLSGGGEVDTYVYSTSADLWLRPMAWEAAADRLRLWVREVQSRDS